VPMRAAAQPFAHVLRTQKGQGSLKAERELSSLYGDSTCLSRQPQPPPTKRSLDMQPIIVRSFVRRQIFDIIFIIIILSSSSSSSTRSGSCACPWPRQNSRRAVVPAVPRRPFTAGRYVHHTWVFVCFYLELLHALPLVGPFNKVGR
jgi:hypothetical protein